MNSTNVLAARASRPDLDPAKESAAKRIVSLEVADLFGIFHHKIVLKDRDRITIIHGPNGFGKTAVLRMVNSLFNGSYSIFWGIPFTSFAVELADGSRLQVEQHTDKGKRGRGHAKSLKVSLTGNGSGQDPFHIKQAEAEERIPFPPFEDFLPFLHRVGPEEWRDVQDGRHLTWQEVLEEYAEHIPSEYRPPYDEPEWLQVIHKSISVHLIGTERLRARGLRRPLPHRVQRPNELAVVRYARELAETIRSKLAESAALSTSLDRTFPARLVGSVTAPVPSDSEIRDRLLELDQKRTRLKSVGLLDKDDDMKFQANSLEEHTKRVLAVYAADTEKKLDVFGDLAAKLELLQTHINSRFLYKKLVISKEEGFVFQAQEGSPLSPSDLSSGEQHELVLLYELLFKIKPGSLILLDEPEISLHVGWQEQFLKDLQQIIRLSDFDVLIATHSPQIINDRWDLTVELTGPSRREDAKANAASRP